MTMPERIWAIDGEDGKRWTPTRPAYDYMTEYVKQPRRRPVLTDAELQELRSLQEEYKMSALGDRPQSMAADRLQRLIALETKASAIFTNWELTPYADASAPAPDAGLGEWRVAEQSIAVVNGRVIIRDADDFWIGEVRREHAEQIVADHNAVAGLVAALTAMLEIVTDEGHAGNYVPDVEQAKAALAAAGVRR